MFEQQPQSLAWGMWKRFLLGGTLVIVLTAAATATAALLQVKQFNDIVLPARNHINFGTDITPDQAGQPQTILVIGSDKRAKSTAVQDRASPPHSDTLMLVRMDPSRGQTSVLSIPRDLKVRLGGPRGMGVQKVNAAYSIGGSRLALRTVKQLLHITVNHVIDVNFQGFRRAVDAVGCVYVDVDHRYFNRNLHTAATNYADINVPAGYRRLCGQSALDYVRYRHTDSDFVRVARQQDFIRQFKEQVGVQGLLDKRDKLERAGGGSIHTDIHGTSTVLRIFKLAAFSVGRPVRQVPFQATPGPSYVVASPAQIRRTVADLLHGDPGSRLPRTKISRRGRRRGSVRALALTAAGKPARDQARRAAAGLSFPVYVPRLVSRGGTPKEVTRYTLKDEQGHAHSAYRSVFSRGLAGEYYGVQGMDWLNPPLLTHPQHTRTIGSRKLELFFDGRHLRWVAWRTPRAVYWVSNTLLESLSNRQMLAIAASAHPLH